MTFEKVIIWHELGCKSMELVTNSIVPFKQSQVDPSLYVHRDGDEYIFMVIYVDDSLYFGSSPELEKKFTDAMSERFKLELQGWSEKLMAVIF